MSWREIADAVAHQRAVRVPVDVVAVTTAERRVQRVADPAQSTARGPFPCVLCRRHASPPWFDVLRVLERRRAPAVTARSPLPSSWIVSWTPTRPSVPPYADPSTRNGPDLAAREVHHVRALHLEPIGARVRRREVDRRGLEDDVLRTEVERGVGRRELVGELRERPVPVGAPAGAEHLPQRREVGRVLDLHDRLVVEAAGARRGRHRSPHPGSRRGR